MGRLTQFLEAAGTACKKTSRRLSMPLILGLGMLGAMTTKAQSTETPKKADNRASVFYRHKIISPEITPVELDLPKPAFLAPKPFDHSELPEVKILNDAPDILDYDLMGYQPGHSKDPMPELPAVTTEQEKNPQAGKFAPTNIDPDQDFPHAPVVIDKKNQLYYQYFPKENIIQFLQANPASHSYEFKGQSGPMSNYFKKHKDTYSELEAIGAAAKHADVPADQARTYLVARNLEHPTFGLSASYGVNFSTSNYYRGPVIRYAGTFALGKPHVGQYLFMEAGYDTYPQDPNRWDMGYFIKGHNFIAAGTFVDIPGHAFLMAGVKTKPTSPLILEAKTGFYSPWQGVNQLANNSNLRFEFKAGFRGPIFGSFIFEGGIMTSATMINPVNEMFMGDKTIKTIGGFAGVKFCPGYKKAKQESAARPIYR